MRGLGRIVLSVVLAGILCGAPGSAATLRGSGGELSAEQRIQLNAAYKEFIRAKSGTDRWYAASEKVLAFGPAGVRKLRPSVAALYRRLGREYQAAFTKASRRVLTNRRIEWKKQGKIAAAVDKEIRAARKAIADVLAIKDLDKATIVSKADPAMKTLEGLMGLRRAAIIESDTDLAEKRGGVLKIWDLRGRVFDGEEDANAERMVTAMEEMLALKTMPISASSRAVVGGNFKLGEKLGAEEAAGIVDLNRIRVLTGREALAIDPLLCEAARGHSKDMDERGFFAHESPVPGKITPWDRAKLAGTTASGENIAMGVSTGAGANRMWFHSPGHFKNMMVSGYRRVGLGRHKRHWTQMFGR